jgi:predicted XRE-type DNA-binding protein
MKKELKDVVRGSGNIYRDFDVVDADVRQLKAILAAEIIQSLDRKKLTVRAAHAATGIDAGDFSRIRNAQFGRVSVERLMMILNRLGSRVQVSVKVKRSTVAEGIFLRPQRIVGAGESSRTILDFLKEPRTESRPKAQIDEKFKAQRDEW